MSELLDDELRQMDERESEQKMEIEEAVSVKDPIRTLELGEMVVVDEKENLEMVIDTFQSRRVACVLVTRKEKLTGIFTERDVTLKLVGRGLDLSREKVADFMTSSPESLKMDDPIAFALNRMTDGGFRHVPIVDGAGRPVGLVAVLDIIRHLASYYSDQVFNLPPEPLRKPQDRPEGG
ncbi:MAG: cyclic nucleotide-binding/CBS domain-containing protein [Fidelibacterota bacterium]